MKLFTNNEKTIDPFKTPSAETAIKAFYTYKHDVGAQDKDIFRTPWQERLTTMTPKEVLSWIRTMLPAVMQARNEHRMRSAQGIADIRSYFIPRPAA